ncbi:MAG: hypothetical protein ABIQ66_04635 [Novosphingobium sp.]
MTPLSRLLAHYLPRALVAPALAAAYALMIIGLLSTRGSGKADIIYVDVKGR